MSVNIDNLRACVDLVDAELGATSAALTESRTAHAATAAELSETLTLLAAAEARIAELEGNVEPPPTPPRFLVGASVVGNGPAAQRTAITAFESQLDGAQIQVLRAFSDAWRLWQQHNASAFQGRGPVIMSNKGTGSWDDLIASIPADQEVYLIATPHEIDRPDRGITPTAFRSTCTALLAAVRRSGRGNVHPSACYTSYRERDTSPPAGYESTAPFFPDEPDAWVMLLDPYDPNNRISLADACTPTLTLWRTYGGHRWGIAEVGTHRTGQDAADWITDGCAWARGEACETFPWFESGVGTAAGPNGWFLRNTGALGIAAFAAQLP